MNDSKKDAYSLILCIFKKEATFKGEAPTPA